MALLGSSLSEEKNYRPQVNGTILAGLVAASTATGPDYSSVRVCANVIRWMATGLFKLLVSTTQA